MPFDVTFTVNGKPTKASNIPDTFTPQQFVDAASKNYGGAVISGLQKDGKPWEEGKSSAQDDTNLVKEAEKGGLNGNLTAGSDTAAVTGGIAGFVTPELLTMGGNVLTKIPVPEVRAAGMGLEAAGLVMQSSAKLRTVATLEGVMDGLASNAAGNFGAQYSKTDEELGLILGPTAVSTVAKGVTIAVKGMKNLGAMFFKDAVGARSQNLLEKELRGGLLKLGGGSDMGTAEANGAMVAFADRQYKKAMNRFTDEQKVFVDRAKKSGMMSDAQIHEHLRQMREKQNAYAQAYRDQVVNKLEQHMGMRFDQVQSLSRLQNKSHVVAFGKPYTVDQVGGVYREAVKARMAEMEVAAKAQYGAVNKAAEQKAAKLSATSPLILDPNLSKLVASIKKKQKSLAASDPANASLEHIKSRLSDPTLTYQSLDNLRRELGQSFERTPEAFKAIGDKQKQGLYGQISSAQKAYVGMKKELGAANRTYSKYKAMTKNIEGMSGLGKVAAGVEGQGADSAAASIKALFRSKETMNHAATFLPKATISSLAMGYTGASVKEMDSAGMKLWRQKNISWLREQPKALDTLNKYIKMSEENESAVTGEVAKLNASDQALHDSMLHLEKLTKTQSPNDAFRFLAGRETSSKDVAYFLSETYKATGSTPEAKKALMRIIFTGLDDRGSNFRDLKSTWNTMRVAMERGNVFSDKDMKTMDTILHRLFAVREYQGLSFAQHLVKDVPAGFVAGNAGVAVDAVNNYRKKKQGNNQ